MYNVAVRYQALELLSQGLTISEVSRRLGVSRFAIREWSLRDPHLEAAGARDCPRCSAPASLPERSADYAYLLGLYLGDGCISRTHRDGVYIMRIFCADAWPGIAAECRAALEAVRPGNKTGVVRKQGCTQIHSYSKHWPCLFPQHGPGKKHERKLELEPWQRATIAPHAGHLVRGLIHSDGCRITNRVRRTLPGGDRWYEYPRYLFGNESGDILSLLGEALDQLGVEWRYSKPNTISVAKREAVGRLDEFVGPKY